LIGLLGLIFVYYWPRGIIPERRRRFAEDAAVASLGPEALTHGGTDH
jgi:hypothetical protein